MIPTFRFALREDLKNQPQFLPTKAEPHATGWDVRAAQKDRQNIIVRPGEYFKIPLGIRYLPDPEWCFELHPRSSTFVKKFSHCLIGQIDESWEGETALAGMYLPNYLCLNPQDLVIEFEEKIAQIIPKRRSEMNVVSVSNEEYEKLCALRGYNRKDGGFGSTGNK